MTPEEVERQIGLQPPYTLYTNDGNVIFAYVMTQGEKRDTNAWEGEVGPFDTLRDLIACILFESMRQGMPYNDAQIYLCDRELEWEVAYLHLPPYKALCITLTRDGQAPGQNGKAGKPRVFEIDMPGGE